MPGSQQPPDNTPIAAYTLTDPQGLEAHILSYGGIIMSLRAPDRDGRVADVTLGFDTPDAYRGSHPYFGTLVGRYANRIRNGRFELGGASYTLARNNGPNHLHGGTQGFDKAHWHVENNGSSQLRLTHRSPDGDEGYPGTLDVTVLYTLADSALRIDYQATTDGLSVVNLTNHAYFNLGASDDILGHELWLNASAFLPVDATMIPIGEPRPMDGTAMDFRAPAAIGARINEPEEQLRLAGGGYDHCWVLDRDGASEPIHAAQVYEPHSGRVMDVYTTQPGVQFYSGNQLDGSISGKQGRVYGKHAGLCLETQHFPDAPNQPRFPSTELAPGDMYRHTTIYRFGVRGAEET